MHNFKKRFKYLLLPATIFEDMGFQYVGPADGHDVEEVRRLLRYAKEQACPVLMHIKTIKGKGYRFSQEKPETFHGTGSFDPETGKPLKESVPTTFSDVFGAELSAIAAEEPRVCAITAAMPVGTGLSGFAERFPDRFIDVGIAEEHAVTMAAGMAKQGMIPVVALYSTFLQRAYDQLIHDAAIHPLHMVFCIDRAGISGEDGETHQGLFDPAFLATIPNMTILAPANERELRRALRRAIFEETGPVAVRYPKGRSGAFRENTLDEPVALLRQSSAAQAVLLTYGILINNTLEAADLLAKDGVETTVCKLNSLKPLPVEKIRRAMGECRQLYVIEDTVEHGSVSQRLAAALPDCRVTGITAGDAFLRCGSVPELQKLLGLDAEGIRRRVIEKE